YLCQLIPLRRPRPTQKNGLCPKIRFAFCSSKIHLKPARFPEQLTHPNRCNGKGHKRCIDKVAARRFCFPYHKDNSRKEEQQVVLSCSARKRIRNQQCTK